MATSRLPVRRYAAECLGAFLLTFAVSASASLAYPIATPVIAATAVAVLVYILGPVSGAHLNPAVTFGLLGLRKVKPLDALFYVVAQFVGALLAYALLSYLVQAPAIQLGILSAGVIAELMGAFVLALGVSSVVLGRVPDAASGLTIGLALFLGIMVASAGSLGVLNPAVALGLGLFNPALEPGLVTNLIVYLAAPLVGGLLGGQIANALKTK